MYTYTRPFRITFSRTWVQHFCLHWGSHEPYSFIQDRR